MWIERLQIIGFGNLSDCSIEFEPDKINLVVEPNEFGKSTIAEAILALFYDFPQQRKAEDRIKLRDAKKPLSTQFYKASCDIVHAGQHLRIIRDFSQKSLKVFDLAAQDKE